MTASLGVPPRRSIQCAGLVLLLVLLSTPRDARGGFGADQRLTGPPDIAGQTAYNNARSVATDSRGRVHVIYHDGRDGMNGDFAPFYREHVPTLGWQPEVRLPDANPVLCRYVSIATDCRDRVHVVFTHNVADPMQGHQLFYKVRDTTGTWGPDVLLREVNPLPMRLDGPSMAVDSRGNVFVVWSEGDQDLMTGDIKWNVHYRVFDAASSTWLPFGAITAYAAFRPFVVFERWWPTVATRDFATGISEAYVAWQDYVEPGLGVRPIRYVPPPLPGAGFSLVGAGNTFLPPPTGVPSAATRCNDLHLVWTDEAGTGAMIHRPGVIASPGAPVFPVPNATGLAGSSPNVCTDGLGNAHVVLLDGAGALTEARWDDLAQTWAVANVVGDPGASAADPSIARDETGDLHVVWADSRAVPPGVGAYYDRGACDAVAPAGIAWRAAADRARLEPELVSVRGAAAVGARIPVIVVARARPDLAALRRQVEGLSASERRGQVARALENGGRARMAPLLAELDASVAAGQAFRPRPLWLVSAVGVEVTPELLDRLAARADVEAIVHDPSVYMLDEESALAPRRGAGARTAIRSPGADPSVPAWSVSWIGAPAVWDLGYRGQCVLVGVVDTGVDLTHPDLANRIWVNGDEDPDNLVDDDGNGFVDDRNGYNFANTNSDPSDDHGHGTHVAGTVAGDGTGGTATGVAPEASVMAIKVLAANGSGSLANVIAGVNYGVANGCQVLNLSLGRYCPTPAQRDLYRLAADAVELAGVTMCVAAGNERCLERPPNVLRTPGDVPPPWLSPGQPPVAGATSGVTTVGATGFMNDVVAYLSSPGPVDWSQPPSYGDWMLCDPLVPGVGLIKPDVCAPGEGVNSTLLGGGYSGDTWDGTSMATPHVAGLAALILSRNNQLLSPAIHQILESTALDQGVPGKDNHYGAGRVSAPAAIAATPPPAGQGVVLVSRAITGGDGDGRLDAGETVGIEATLLNDGVYPMGDVVGLLTDNSASVTIPVGSAAFGDIPVDAARDNASNPFTVSVGSGAADGEVVTFTLLVSAYGGCGVLTFSDTIQNSVVGVPYGGEAPQALAVREVAPNPARSGTTFGVAVSRAGRLRLVLHDLFGRRVRTLLDEEVAAGIRRVAWDGHDETGRRVTPGVYFTRASMDAERAERRFVVVRE